MSASVIVTPFLATAFLAIAFGFGLATAFACALTCALVCLASAFAWSFTRFASTLALVLLTLLHSLTIFHFSQNNT